MSLGRQHRLGCGADPAALVDQVAEGHPGPRGDHQHACSRCRAALAYLGKRWPPAGQSADGEAPPPWLAGPVMARVRRAALGPSHSLHDGPRGRTIVTEGVLQALARQAISEVPGVRLAPGRPSLTGPSPWSVVAPATGPVRAGLAVTSATGKVASGADGWAVASPIRDEGGPSPTDPLHVEVTVGAGGSSAVRVRLSLVAEMGEPGPPPGALGTTPAAMGAAATAHAAAAEPRPHLLALATAAREAVAAAIEGMTHLPVTAVDVAIVDVVPAGAAVTQEAGALSAV